MSFVVLFKGGSRINVQVISLGDHPLKSDRKTFFIKYLQRN